MYRTMSGPHPLPPKKEVALALLERSSVHVHLDPRVAGVVVPQWFKKQAQLVLQIGLNMPIPIPDLRLDETGMSCTLSFSRSPFYCVVPWQSVYALVGDDGRGMVWPDDVPPEVAQARDAAAAKRPPVKRVAEETSERSEAGKVAKKPRKRPRAVPDSEGESRAPLAAVPPPDTPKRPAPVPQALPQPVPKPVSEAAQRRPNGRSKRELPPYLRVVK